MKRSKMVAQTLRKGHMKMKKERRTKQEGTLRSSVPTNGSANMNACDVVWSCLLDDDYFDFDGIDDMDDSTVAFLEESSVSTYDIMQRLRMPPSKSRTRMFNKKNSYHGRKTLIQSLSDDDDDDDDVESDEEKQSTVNSFDKYSDHDLETLSEEELEEEEEEEPDFNDLKLIKPPRNKSKNSYEFNMHNESDPIEQEHGNDVCESKNVKKKDQDLIPTHLKSKNEVDRWRGRAELFGGTQVQSSREQKQMQQQQRRQLQYSTPEDMRERLLGLKSMKKNIQNDLRDSSKNEIYKDSRNDEDDSDDVWAALEQTKRSKLHEIRSRKIASKEALAHLRLVRHSLSNTDNCTYW